MESSGRKRILVTGASGVFGREIVGRLARRGHEVVGTSRSEPANMPPGVRWVQADITDPDAVSKAMAGCEVVAHCAWAMEGVFDPQLEWDINVGGTMNVIEAMRYNGAQRMVFASSNTAYGPQDDQTPLTESAPLNPHPDHGYGLCKQEVEALMAEAPFETVPIRAVPVLGRVIDNRVFTLVAGPGLINIRGKQQVWQAVHSSDVGRFFALACESGPSGPVNLGAPTTFDVYEMAEVLGKPVLEVPEGVLDKALGFMWRREFGNVSPADLAFVASQPIVDSTRARDEFGFEFSFDGLEIVRDTKIATRSQLALGPQLVTIPWRQRYYDATMPDDTPPAAGGELVVAGPPEHVGEFDTNVDPRFDTYIATNMSEALPGPATAMSLTAVVPAIRGSMAAAADLVGLTGASGVEARARFSPIFGHRVYMNLVCSMAIGDMSPGWTAESIAQQYLGRHAAKVDLSDPETLPIDRPDGRWEALKTQAALLGRTLGVAIGMSKDIDNYTEHVAWLDELATGLESATDTRLSAVADLARSLMTDGWALAGRAAVLAGALNNMADDLVGRVGAVEEVGEGLTSGESFAETRRLAELAREDDQLRAALVSGEDVDTIRSSFPDFATELHQALERVGHRGPGEVELANPSFADDPGLLLRAVSGMLVNPSPAPTASRRDIPLRARAIVRRAARVTGERERGRSELVRTGAILRRILRERGRRLVDDGVIDQLDDVWHLTYDQVWFPPDDARETVARRRAERERLAGIRLPIAFNVPWAPLEDDQRLAVGEVLDGVGISSGGVQRGRVRIVRPDNLHEFEPGEVMVASVTDVGFTPLFGIAAAVVTDIGGPMSHAAVVAREFNIPAVLDTAVGTGRLTDGMLVEVDPEAGTVRRLPEEDVAVPFDGGPELPGAEPARLLGSKGMSLTVMTREGLPVPPGFTLTTAACRTYLAEGWQAPFTTAIRQGVEGIEDRTGKQFGGGVSPLLVSVRSGAVESMPGMMDTVLNVGMNDEVEASLAAAAGDATFAADTHRRALTSYASVVLGADDHTLQAAAAADSPAEARQALAQAGYNVPVDPHEQLIAAVRAVFDSWNTPRAKHYREVEGIPHDLGTAATVQAMVYGNLGDRSGTGVAFTRDPATGARELMGDFLPTAQGEDVVAGGHATLTINDMATTWPDVHGELTRVADQLEHRFRDMVDIEFTVEDGRLWILQARRGKRSAIAALRIAIDMAEDGGFPVDRADAVRRCAEILDDPPLVHAEDDLDGLEEIVRGLAASPGVASGVLCLDPDEAVELEADGIPVVLARRATSPADIHGMAAAEGLLTQLGGRVSHAAVVARSWGVPAVVGAAELEIGQEGIRGPGGEVIVGEMVTVDGDAGRLCRGSASSEGRPAPEVFVLRRWQRELDQGKVHVQTDDQVPFPLIHALRIKGMATLSTIAAMAELDDAEAWGRLDELADAGLAKYVEARGLWAITPAGRTYHHECMEKERTDLDLGRLPYADFLELNTVFKELCTAWQERGDADADTLLGRLVDHDRATQALLPAVVEVVPWTGHYPRRLQAALQRVQQGDLDAFTGVMKDSYHDIWMELHEDLILTQGIERADEGSA